MVNSTTELSFHPHLFLKTEIKIVITLLFRIKTHIFRVTYNPTKFTMSQTSRLLQFGNRVPQLVDAGILKESINDDRSDLSLEPISAEEETICIQDYLNSPEFIEEQRVIFLEIEAERLRIDDERKARFQGERVLSRCNPRRSSIGIKLTCPVCLESLGSVKSSYVKMVTECGHVFCKDCIESVCKAAESGGKNHVALCPVCREEVGELRKVYF